jgi:hypothetical protein
MNRCRFLAALIPLLLLAALLGACGNKGDLVRPAPPAKPATTPAPAPAAQPAPPGATTTPVQDANGH